MSQNNGLVKRSEKGLLTPDNCVIDHQPHPEPARGEQVVAFVSFRDGMLAVQKDLMECALQRLADFKVPQKIGFVDSLPKGITGKVQRRAVKETAFLRRSLDVGPEAK